MAAIFLLHWNQGEAQALAVSLRKAGHAVSVHWSTDTGPNLKDALPEIAVISLDRLPSHGRAVAEWLWEAKKRRHIPIIFAGGAPEKVIATRAKFPRALFCPTSEIVGRIGEALANGPGLARHDEGALRRAKARTTKRSDGAPQRPSSSAKAPKSGSKSRAARR